MAERRALVTGAAGFLGRHVARALAERGWRVEGLGHGTWGRPEWTRHGLADWIPADVTLESLLDRGGAPELLVHCAGGSSIARSVSDPLLDFQRTVDTTAAALEFLRRRAPEAALVLPSSGSVYGSASAERVTEDAPLHPESPYAAHKLAAEGLCASTSRCFGLRTAVIRFFSLYGVGLRKQLLWDACTRISRGDRTFAGTGQETRDWLHVEDAAALVAEAAARASPAGLVVNGGTGVGATVSDVVEALAIDLGRPGAATFSGARRSGDPFRFVADGSRARSWGWAPRTAWRDGVRQYAAWFAAGAP